MPKTRKHPTEACATLTLILEIELFDVRVIDFMGLFVRSYGIN